jgi:transcriptional regulator with XRE-family HTH domain
MTLDWDPLPFQNMIRDFLDRRGWSQNDLAKQTGISQAVINRWMQPPDSDSPAGLVKPSDRTLRKLAPIVGHSEDALLRMVGRLQGAPPRVTARPPDLTALLADLDAAWDALSEERRGALSDAVRGVAQVHRPRRRNRRQFQSKRNEERDSDSISHATYALLTT